MLLADPSLQRGYSSRQQPAECKATAMAVKRPDAFPVVMQQSGRARCGGLRKNSTAAHNERVRLVEDHGFAGGIWTV